MPAYLSPEWLERAAEVIQDDEELNAAVREVGPDTDVTVVYAIRDAPAPAGGGEITYSITLGAAGVRLASPARSGDAESTVTLSLDYATAAAVNQGELDPAVAMALARVRVSGAAGKLVPLQSELGRVPAALMALREETSY